MTREKQQMVDCEPDRRLLIALAIRNAPTSEDISETIEEMDVSRRAVQMELKLCASIEGKP